MRRLKTLQAANVSEPPRNFLDSIVLFDTFMNTVFPNGGHPATCSCLRPGSGTAMERLDSKTSCFNIWYFGTLLAFIHNGRLAWHSVVSANQTASLLLVGNHTTTLFAYLWATLHTLLPRDFPRPMANPWRTYHVTDISTTVFSCWKAAVVEGSLGLDGPILSCF